MFATLPKARQDEIRKAFKTLQAPSQLFVPKRGGNSDEPPPQVVNEIALPHLCRVMNLCVTEDDLHSICNNFAFLGGGKDEKRALPSSSNFLLPQTEFDFDAVVRLHDSLAPAQPEHAALYFQFFNLLDVHESGSVSQADLRHSLCSAGERLTEEEFNHLLYVNDLLQKPRITVFEFVRLLLRVKANGEVTS